ncbi:MAG: ATP-binding protein [Adhaeribacter sp.]
MSEKIKVLLIDDDEDDYIITREIISDIPASNYSLDWTASFSEALDLIAQRRHDVYLVDYRLGVHDGLELINRAIAGGSTAPLILLTGQSDRETDEKAMRLGASDYLVKGTFKPYDLERSIRYSIEHAKNLEEIQKLNTELEQRVVARTQELAQAITQLENTNKTLFKAQQEIKKALQKEKELNELKSRFVTIASHEFRTPLSTVLSSASLIGKYKLSEDDDKRQKHVNRIKSAVSNLTTILNDFLSLSRIEEGKVYNVPTAFELVPLVGDIVEEMQGYIKVGQQIHYRHQGPEELVTLDKQLFKNILLNLLSNASKYSAEEKNIYLDTEISPEKVIIRVRDEGIGIPEADRAHLFTLFFRAQNAANYEGTGLGLNIVKRYVDLMNGRLQFDSVLDQGTTFTIELPRKNEG